MGTAHETALRKLNEKAEGMAEQLASLSLPDLTRKYDSGDTSPEVNITVPARVTSDILDVGTNDRELGEQFESMVYEKTENRIQTILRCKEASVFVSNNLPLRRGQFLRLTVRAFF